jgi:fatty acid elongase 3
MATGWEYNLRLIRDLGWKDYYFNWNLLNYRPPLFYFGETIWVIFGYLATIRFLEFLMSFRSKPIDTSGFAKIHNFILFVGSVIMLLGFVSSIFMILAEHDMFTLFCDPDRKARSGPLYFWIYVFQWSKIYEFLDTVILVLKKKQLLYLHVWHHCTTYLLVWFSLTGEMSIQFLSQTVNCFVHIPMYYYYWMSSMGYQNIWWKKYITSLQIFQFVTTIGINCYWIYCYLTYDKPCSGPVSVFFLGQGILVTFLFLFIDFFNKNYQEKSKQE